MAVVISSASLTAYLLPPPLQLYPFPSSNLKRRRWRGRRRQISSERIKRWTFITIHETRRERNNSNVLCNLNPPPSSHVYYMIKNNSWINGPKQRADKRSWIALFLYSFHTDNFSSVGNEKKRKYFFFFVIFALRFVSNCSTCLVFFSLFLYNNVLNWRMTLSCLVHKIENSIRVYCTCRHRQSSHNNSTVIMSIEVRRGKKTKKNKIKRKSR